MNYTLKDLKLPRLLLLLLFGIMPIISAILIGVPTDLKIKATYLSMFFCICGVLVWLITTCIAFYSNPENKGK